MAGKKAKTKATHAVYRGAGVQLFEHDLSNYSQLRRGLTAELRAQTMTKTELAKVDQDVARRYIDALNDWRKRPQKEKAERTRAGAAIEIRNLTEVFLKAVKDGSYTPNEKAEIMAANLKIQSLPVEQARFEIRSSLSALDRSGGDWYKASDYWTDLYYMDNAEWDPAQATTSMLRVAILYILPNEHTEYEEATKSEYKDRLGEFYEQEMAAEKAQYNRDVIKMAKSITTTKK